MLAKKSRRSTTEKAKKISFAEEWFDQLKSENEDRIDPSGVLKLCEEIGGFIYSLTEIRPVIVEFHFNRNPLTALLCIIVKNCVKYCFRSGTWLVRNPYHVIFDELIRNGLHSPKWMVQSRISFQNNKEIKSQNLSKWYKNRPYIRILTCQTGNFI